MTDEEFYDTEIAPALLVLAKKCEGRKIPLIAAVGYEPDNWGRTVFLPADPPWPFRVANTAFASRNVDLVIGQMVAYAEKHGHSSAYLKLLNVPMVPASTAETVEPGREQR